MLMSSPPGRPAEQFGELLWKLVNSFQRLFRHCFNPATQQIDVDLNDMVARWEDADICSQI